MATTPNYAPGTGGADKGAPNPTYVSSGNIMGQFSGQGAKSSVSGPLKDVVFETKRSKKARSAYNKAVAQAKTYAKQQYAFQKSEAELRKGIAGVDKAYEAAKLQSARGAEQARQTIRQEGQAAGAAATQSMMNRGLYGTTVQDQAQRAVTADMARNLGMVDVALAAEQGSLGVSQAMAKAGGLGGIAALYPQLAGMQTDTMFKFIEAFRPPPPKPNIFGQALGAIAQGFGGGLGGMVGKKIFG